MGVLYIQAGGGAGDFIYHYFMSYRWNCIPTIKTYFSDCKITAVLACHQASVAELIYTNPYIDSVLIYPWYPPGDRKESEWKYMVTGQDLEVWARDNNIKEASYHGLEHKVYLTPEEEVFFEKVRMNGKYIVIHPFAGLPHRGCLPHPHDGKYKCYPDYKYIQSANILAKQGYKVYILGRTSHDGKELLRSNKEELISFSGEPFEDGVINLIDKVSFRVNVELTRRASGFLGSHSSMLSAAWTGRVPSIFFYPGFDEYGNKKSVIDHGGTTGTWALNQPQNYYYEMNINNFLKLDPQEPVDKLLSLIG